MISTAQDMLKALKGSTPRYTGVILYEGRSAIDGGPIVVIANRIANKSNNEKTGGMVQTFIIRQDVRPLEALATGLDKSICGGCIHRPANGGTCYVNVGRSVESVYGAYQRGRYARPGKDYDASILPDLFEGSVFRLGTYGDPAAAPFRIWANATAKVKARTGYTHQWKRKSFEAFKSICMASVDSPRDLAMARAMGWRSFRVRAKDAATIEGEVICPASKEAGQKTTCEACKACGGLSAKARADIVIMAHGPTGGRFT
jgi:hypothetical protein